MTKFCTKCGKPLTDGEVCDCQKVNQEQKVNVQKSEANQSENKSEEKVDVFGEVHKISEKIENGLDGIYNFISPSKDKKTTTNKIPFRNLFGLSREDKIDEMGDCYERGQMIVPDLVQPCGQEVPIRQYDICSCRSLIRGLWQEGKLQVTNKRVLFRLSGRNWVGKALSNIEFSLDEIAGVNIKTSNKLSVSAFIMNLLYMFVFTAITMLLVTKMPKVMAIFGLILFLASTILVRRHYYFKLAVTSVSMWCFSAGMAVWPNKFWMIGTIVVSILMIVNLVMASLKPNLEFTVLTKCASTGAIQVQRVNRLESMITWNMEVLPGKDAVRAMDEVGTMVNDIQRFGDFGIQKWKES